MIRMPNESMVDMVQPINLLHPLSRGLAALWAGIPGTQGGSRFMDFVNPGPNGVHGTLTSMDPVTDWLVGNLRIGGYALDLDGSNDYVTIPDAPQLDMPGAYSYGLWVKSTEASNTVLLEKGSNDHFMLQPHGGGAGNLKVATDEVIVGGWDAVDDGLWHHIMVVRTAAAGGTNLLVYIDGEEFATSSIGFNTPNSSPLVLGSRSGGAAWEGQTGSLILYDRALSSSEVQFYYNRPLAMLTLRRRVYAAVTAGPPVGLSVPEMLMLRSQGPDIGSKLFTKRKQILINR